MCWARAVTDIVLPVYMKRPWTVSISNDTPGDRFVFVNETGGVRENLERFGGVDLFILGRAAAQKALDEIANIHDRDSSLRFKTHVRRYWIYHQSKYTDKPMRLIVKVIHCGDVFGGKGAPIDPSWSDENELADRVKRLL